MSLGILPKGRKSVKEDPGLLSVALDYALAIQSLSHKLASMLAHPIGNRGVGDPFTLWCRGTGARDALAMSQAILGTPDGAVHLTLQVVAGQPVETVWMVRHESDAIHLDCISHKAGDTWGVIGWLSDLRATGLTQEDATAQAGTGELAVPLLELI